MTMGAPASDASKVIERLTGLCKEGLTNSATISQLLSRPNNTPAMLSHIKAQWQLIEDVLLEYDQLLDTAIGLLGDTDLRIIDLEEVTDTCQEAIRQVRSKLSAVCTDAGQSKSITWPGKTVSKAENTVTWQNNIVSNMGYTANEGAYQPSSIVSTSSETVSKPYRTISKLIKTVPRLDNTVSRSSKITTGTISRLDNTVSRKGYMLCGPSKTASKSSESVTKLNNAIPSCPRETVPTMANTARRWTSDVAILITDRTNYTHSGFYNKVLGLGNSVSRSDISARLPAALGTNNMFSELTNTIPRASNAVSRLSHDMLDNAKEALLVEAILVEALPAKDLPAEALLVDNQALQATEDLPNMEVPPSSLCHGVPAGNPGLTKLKNICLQQRDELVLDVQNLALLYSVQDQEPIKASTASGALHDLIPTEAGYESGSNREQQTFQHVKEVLAVPTAMSGPPVDAVFKDTTPETLQQDTVARDPPQHLPGLPQQVHPCPNYRTRGHGLQHDTQDPATSTTSGPLIGTDHETALQMVHHGLQQANEDLAVPSAMPFVSTSTYNCKSQGLQQTSEDLVVPSETSTTSDPPGLSNPPPPVSSSLVPASVRPPAIEALWDSGAVGSSPVPTSVHPHAINAPWESHEETSLDTVVSNRKIIQNLALMCKPSAVQYIALVYSVQDQDPNNARQSFAEVHESSPTDMPALLLEASVSWVHCSVNIALSDSPASGTNNEDTYTRDPQGTHSHHFWVQQETSNNAFGDQTPCLTHSEAFDS